MRKKGIAPIVLALSFAAAVQADTFTITIENVGVQPITPMFLATHDATFDMFDEGAAASPALVDIAEAGDTTAMVTLASGSAGVLDVEVGGFLMPGESFTLDVTADPDHPYLSFAAMLPVTNDAFIGGAAGDGALDLFRLGTPQFYDFTLAYNDVWDAGSEINTESAADVPALGGAGSPDEGGVITIPHPGILGVADVGPEFDFYGLDVARVIVVPEPTTMFLLSMGGLLFARRR